MLLRKMLLTVLFSLVVFPAFAAPDLYFSEYIEGSSNNKALEIANTMGATVDLSSYEVQIYFNGNTTPELTIPLAGTIANNTVFVLANSSASPEILNVANQTNGASWFNGDDAIVLLNSGTVVDSIGQIGVDPGVEWGIDNESTQNNTLRRIEPVLQGDNNTNDAFDPSFEWAGFLQNDFSGLGSFSGSGVVVANIIINELDSDTPSTDSVEFIELYDGGVGNTSLDGLVLVFFNGSDDASYQAIDLDGLTTNSHGYFVIGSAGVENVDLVAFTTNGIQNGADAVALFVGNADDFTNDTPVTTENLVDAIAYDTDDADDIALLSGLNLTKQINEAENGDKDKHSIQRCGDSFTQTLPTPGNVNRCSPVDEVGQCNAPATLISAIQGSADSSPLVNTNVEVEGIVVGDFQRDDQLRGFYLQEEVADQDDNESTSEGIFVFADTDVVDVNVGDRVRVAGGVVEFFGQTQMTNISGVRLCETGLTLAPTVVTFPVETASALEPVEGMLVTIPQTMVVTENFNLGRFHEVSLASERLYQPTHLVQPGPSALALQEENNLKRIILDDASTQQNLEIVSYPAPALSAANSLRSGDTVASITGVMSYSFDAYRIQPTNTPNFVSTNGRTAESELADHSGNLTVASFNVLNYFNGDGQGGGFPTARGADTFAEFERQRAKIINALLAIDADIVGLVELENDGYGPLSAIQDLVNGLNSKGQHYAVVNPGVNQIGSDAITVGFIYKTDRVATINATAILNSRVDARFIDTKNRPALAQTFKNLANNSVITLVINHFKSKGSACDDVGDTDQQDGQGNCNGTRTLAAQALSDWLATDPTNSGDEDIMILGDLNAYAKEDPISTLVNAGYHDLLNAKFGSSAYSFVFQGQSGYLDYALANDALLPQVEDVAEWHINADEPRALDYNEEFKSPEQVIHWYSPEPYRASDHDPVIIRLNLQADLLGDFNRNGELDRDDFYLLIDAVVQYRRNILDKNFDLNSDNQINGQDIYFWLDLLISA